MHKNRLAKSLVLALPCILLAAASAVTPTQAPAPKPDQPPVTPRTQPDPYAAAFAGLTYTAQQKEAISKIRQDIEYRKDVVRKSDKLNDDQKNAMLTGYTRMEYSQIYKELTIQQKKLVSARLHAAGLDGQAAQKPAAPQP